MLSFRDIIIQEVTRTNQTPPTPPCLYDAMPRVNRYPGAGRRVKKDRKIAIKSSYLTYDMIQDMTRNPGWLLSYFHGADIDAVTQVR